MKKIMRISGLLLLLSWLTACGMPGAYSGIYSNPNAFAQQQLKKLAEESDIDLVLVGEDKINLNFYGEPTPVTIEIFQLQDKARFLAADYDSLSISDKSYVLSKTYLDHEEYTIDPSSHQYIKNISISPRTRFLGLIAHFGDIDSVLWKKIIRVDGVGDDAKVIVIVKPQEVRFERMEK